MGQGGGTRMWCPKCESIEVLKAVPAAHITGQAQDHHQRWYRQDYPDIHWFQRGRECLECSHTFLTGEAQLEMLQDVARQLDGTTGPPV